MHAQTFDGVKTGTCRAAIMAENVKALDKATGSNGWGARHVAAFNHPNATERGIVSLVLALADYADGYAATCGEGDGVGTDGYAAPYFIELMHAARGLLSMETGRLDCGTLDSMLWAIGRAAGFTDAELQS
jgi:hypothetical protein